MVGLEVGELLVDFPVSTIGAKNFCSPVFNLKEAKEFQLLDLLALAVADGKTSLEVEGAVSPPKGTEVTLAG